MCITVKHCNYSFRQWWQQYKQLRLNTSSRKVCPGSNYENSVPMVVKDAAADDNDGDVDVMNRSNVRDWLVDRHSMEEQKSRKTRAYMSHLQMDCLKTVKVLWIRN